MKRKPDWLKVRLPTARSYGAVQTRLRLKGLNTICESGHCPNQRECWGHRTATFMLLGDMCTRNCSFCNVGHGRPALPDAAEQAAIAAEVVQMELQHVVLTSVSRDDLPDQGVGQWIGVISEIKKRCPAVTIEALIPDFSGCESAIACLIGSGADIISHNLETVKSLTPAVRYKADYDVSIALIRQVSRAGVRAKSGLMLGLGEQEHEVVQAMRDLYAAGCEVLTLGQYLQPSRKHVSVQAYITPTAFDHYRDQAFAMGFACVESGPLVRSSYRSYLHVRSPQSIQGGSIC